MRNGRTDERPGCSSDYTPNLKRSTLDTSCSGYLTYPVMCVDLLTSDPCFAGSIVAVYVELKEFLWFRKMSIVAVKVLSTVNAPYGTTLSAEQLAAKISDPASAVSFEPSAFSFFSEVDESLQISFLDEMHVDPMAASDLARKFSALAGYPLPLARAA